jgi:hypothetical protein
MSRGVLYMVWGEKAERVMARSIASLKEIHPELPYEVVRLPPHTDGIKGLLEKSRMLELSPFEETLYLDCDTVVLDRLDYGFAQAIRYGVACCICECPWARRYRGLPKDDGIEYNTGVLFFNRAAAALFQRWHELVTEVDSTIDFVLPNGQLGVMPFNDQGGFAKAVSEWDRAPFVLPFNWNFRPMWQWTFFGPIKVWHDYSDPPPQLKQLNAAYRRPDAVIQFHRRPGNERGDLIGARRRLGNDGRSRYTYLPEDSNGFFGS